MIRVNNKVALYARFSSDNQRTESIDAQLRSMREYCKQKHLIIVETYIDEAKSATTDRRPAFQQMIMDSSKKRFDILLVHKLDRFARNRYDSAVYKRELRKNGVSVYSVLENLDDRPESVMMESILEGMAEYYSKNLGREVMKGMRENALQCKHTGGKPPLGYDVDPVTKKLVLNEREAEAVKLIFNMYSKGYGYSAILDKLHEGSYLTKKGTAFRKNSLYSILTNPKYQGIYVYNRCSAKTELGTRNTHLHKDIEDMVIIEGGCPQIVDRAVFARVQERLQQNIHQGGRSNAKMNYLLSGKVYCRECGRAMTGNYRESGRDKLPYVTYRCPTKKHSCSNKEINRDYLESYVIELLEDKILNRRALGHLIRKIENWEEQKYAMGFEQQAEVTKELEEVEESLRNVVDAIAAGLLSEVLVARLQELEQRKQALEAALIHDQEDKGVSTVDPEEILAEYAAVKRGKGLPSYKDFIGSLIERIEVGRYSVRITLRTGLDIVSELNTSYEVRRQEIYEQKKTVS